MKTTNPSTPTYDLEEAKRLVAKKRFSVGRKASTFIINRYDDAPEDLVKMIFELVKSSGFKKTMELERRPGVMADVYHVEFDDMTWYLKFFIDAEDVRVRVWSCNWDTCMH